MAYVEKSINGEKFPDSLFALSVFGVHSLKKEKDVMICQLEKNLEIEVIRIL